MTDEEYDQVFYGGKGKRKGKHRSYAKGSGRRRNPIGCDGELMKCGICNSEEHFRAFCPQIPNRGGKGAGKGLQGYTDSGPIGDLIGVTFVGMEIVADRAQSEMPEYAEPAPYAAGNSLYYEWDPPAVIDMNDLPPWVPAHTPWTPTPAPAYTTNQYDLGGLLERRSNLILETLNANEPQGPARHGLPGTLTEMHNPAANNPEIANCQHYQIIRENQQQHQVRRPLGAMPSPMWEPLSGSEGLNTAIGLPHLMASPQMAALESGHSQYIQTMHQYQRVNYEHVLAQRQQRQRMRGARFAREREGNPLPSTQTSGVLSTD